MTALSIERFAHPTRRPGAAPRKRAVLHARVSRIGTSVRAARAFESAASPSEQLRVVEDFAASLAR